MLDEKKTAIAEQVKGKWTREAEAAGQIEHSDDSCENCLVGSGCINAICRYREMQKHGA